MLHFLPGKISVQLQHVQKMKDSTSRTEQTKAAGGTQGLRLECAGSLAAVEPPSLILLGLDPGMLEFCLCQLRSTSALSASQLLAHSQL